MRSGDEKKSTDYDYAATSASLGLPSSNSRAIESALKPPPEDIPRKPTVKELSATVKEQAKKLVDVGRQLRMKAAEVLKLRRDGERKTDTFQFFLNN